MHPKFIVERTSTGGLRLVIGKTQFHKDMAADTKSVHVGGFWSLKDNIFTLSGRSEDFGPCCIDILKQAVNSGNIVIRRSIWKEEGVPEFVYKNEVGELTNLKEV